MIGSALLRSLIVCIVAVHPGTGSSFLDHVQCPVAFAQSQHNVFLSFRSVPTFFALLHVIRSIRQEASPYIRSPFLCSVVNVCQKYYQQHYPYPLRHSAHSLQSVVIAVFGSVSVSLRSVRCGYISDPSCIQITVNSNRDSNPIPLCVADNENKTYLKAVCNSHTLFRSGHHAV